MKITVARLLVLLLSTCWISNGLAAAEEYFVQTKNVVYGESHGVGLVMDVFVPTGKKNGLGIVDVISGGYSSDRGKIRDHMRAQVFGILCRKGYTVFAVRPGSASRFSIADMLGNLNTGIRWTKQHAKTYEVDPQRLGLMGASAGGHLACLAAVAPQAGTDVKAAAAFFPLTDFLDYGGRKIDVRQEGRLSSVLRKLIFPDGIESLGDEEIDRALTRFSPARLVGKQTPPLLLIHGDADPVVPLQQSQTMLAALQKHGVESKLIVKKGGAHPWPTIHEEVALLAKWFDGRLKDVGTKSTGESNRAAIVVDGNFKDWAKVPSHIDPMGDPHDTDHKLRTDTPAKVEHPDVDLLEYKVAHDDENLYCYLRAKGRIGNTQVASPGKRAGRYYVVLTIDVDCNDETGYWISEGGYYPTTKGYDVNAEVEYYGGKFNTGHYLNHGARNDEELKQAFLDQTQNRYVKGNDGPYQPGFMRVLPGTYDFYTQWVYHKNGSITIVRDKGPVVLGIVTSAISKDGHEIEACFPFKGFLTDKAGKPIVAKGQSIDISFSLEASGELAPGGAWASDTGEPIENYRLSPMKK